MAGASVPHTVVSPTKITLTTPPHAAGPVPVAVTTAGGSVSSPFTYAAPPLTTRLDIVKTPTTTTPGTFFGGTWSTFTSPSAYKGSYLRSSTAGAYVLICFKGTRLDWITMKGTTGAVADIYLDGSATKAASINCYVASPVYQKNLWSTGTLPDGCHTVKILRSSSSARGRYLTIDAVEVAGVLVSPTRIEENKSPSPFSWNPAFTSWTLRTTSSASGGAYHSINTIGAYVSFKFSGVGLKIIATTASNYGNLTVTVDGVNQTVSLFSSPAAYKNVVFTKFLAPAPTRSSSPGRPPRAPPLPATPSTSMLWISTG